MITAEVAAAEVVAKEEGLKALESEGEVELVLEEVNLEDA